MVDVRIEGTTLHIEVKGFDKLWAFKSHLEIPLAHVGGAAPATDEAHQKWHGIRAPGTHLPGVITAGSFHQSGQWVFWDVHDAARAIEIRLHDERYARLVVEVADPAATLALIARHTGG